MHNLPVRKVNIFGHSFVIPNDTACELNLKYTLENYIISNGSGGDSWHEAKFELFIEIRLYHSYFPGREKLIKERVCSIVSGKENEKLLQRKLRHVNGEPTIRMKDSASKALVNKAINSRKLDDKILTMFLEGDINLKGLQALLPGPNLFC